ncbi:MAG TPA: PKD domain-containing protein [Bacteroidia bacterium]|jgi:gliding motility-associated-like protein
MESKLQTRLLIWLSFILMFIQTSNEAFASHAQSADITYQCLGGNQYQISLSFYRDCAGAAAPTTASINLASASCGQNYNITLNQLPGTGIEVSPICAAFNTECTGGTYPGVQEYIYRGVTTLPASCTDWVFSFTLCCRNASIGTIAGPASENIYVEAHLDNFNFPCNSSPNFSNDPVPFVCVGQPYCFNNGSSDPDGDSLYFTLITPQTSSTTTVTYISPYSASQPLASSPPVTFNNFTGDMCMTPSMLQVTVFAVLVQEYRNEILVGSVMRDIQMRTITCSNNNPYVNGINNTGTYSLIACAGTPINFNISTFDVDAAQNVSITWNSGIAAASFTTTAGSRPVATFSWTPTVADISTSSHCFTITVQDNNCPYNGSQTFSFCITVSGLVINTSTSPANCNASNGTADVSIVAGTGPFTYQWLPSGGTTPSENGLYAGTYTVNVTDAGGCSSSATATVGTGAAPGNVNMNFTDVSCFGLGDGSATANASGGTPPYTYLWNTGATTSTITGLTPGTYYVTVTTSNGCTKDDTITIAQPAAPLSYSISQTNVSCYGTNNGMASIVVAGGTAPYDYLWNTSPAQTSATATNLYAGVLDITVTDDNGCTITSTMTISQPAALIANAMVINNVSCNGLSDGYVTVGASGGTGAFNYMWNTSPVQYVQTVSGLSPGNYTATVTDANSCTVSSSITITEPAALTLSSAGFPATCNGSTNGQGVIIPSGGTPTYTYQWLPSGGTSASATGLSPGTYNATATDANGCTITATITITQPSVVITTATGSTTICSGQNTNITGSASGGTGAYTFTWTGIGTGATQTVSPSSPTTYNVVATDANGCAGNTASVSINVTSLTAANLTVSPGSAICYGNSANVYSNVFGNTGAVTINWSGGLGSGNGPFTVSPPSSTTYVVTVSDACGATITSSVPVTVNPLPVISIAPQSIVSCEQATLVYVDNSTTNAGAQYSWTFGDGNSSSQVSPSNTYYASGIYTINVIVTSPFGCLNNASTTSTVVVNPGTTAQFSEEGLDGTTLSPTYRFTDQSTNAASRFWTFGDGGTSVLTDPLHTYPDKGLYTVSLVTITTAGCRDSVSKVVEIVPLFTLYIPNAFTPDGNGTNDQFIPKGSEISSFSMMIFDRWGEMIFQTDDLSKGWDGRANNGDKVAQQGVYVYKIEVRDFSQKHHGYTGHVTLLANNE